MVLCPKSLFFQRWHHSKHLNSVSILVNWIAYLLDFQRESFCHFQQLSSFIHCGNIIEGILRIILVLYMGCSILACNWHLIFRLLGKITRHLYMWCRETIMKDNRLLFVACVLPTAISAFTQPSHFLALCVSDAAVLSQET